MQVILTSNEDIASVNIREHLLDMADWEDVGEFSGNAVLKNNEFYLVTIDTIHLFFDDMDVKFSDAIGLRPDYFIVASRHKSESKLRTLTIHPLGNFSTADFGGHPSSLVPTAPREMTHALLTLKEKAVDLDFKISFEATHHGPYLKTPLFFIEIGSDESAWPEKPPAKAIAETILSLSGHLRTKDDIVCLGIGGGHYMPRISDAAITHKMSFGHMVPSYALDALDITMIKQAIEKTPSIDAIYFHRKGMSKPKYRELVGLCESIDFKVLSSKDIEER